MKRLPEKQWGDKNHEYMRFFIKILSYSLGLRFA